MDLSGSMESIYMYCIFLIIASIPEESLAMAQNLARQRESFRTSVSNDFSLYNKTHDPFYITCSFSLEQRGMVCVTVKFANPQIAQKFTP